jgi:hypothetical protein
MFHRQIIFLLLFVMLALGSVPYPVSAGSKTKSSATDEIERILNHLESSMQSSREQIEQGNYEAAQSGKAESIEALTFLLDLFLPLTERIKQLWEEERRIISGSEAAVGNDVHDSKSAASAISHLSESQRLNSEKTRKAVSIIQQQLVAFRKKEVGGKGRQEDVSEQKNGLSQEQVLEKAGGYLEQSVIHQDEAVRHLNDLNPKSALKPEFKAAEKLKEALDLFQKSQQSKSPQKKPSGEQPPGEKKENQPQGEGQQKDGAPSQQPDRESDPTVKVPEKKLTPRQALKELYRVQKEAEAEKRKRERALGKQTVPGRSPIEKDW